MGWFRRKKKASNTLKASLIVMEQLNTNDDKVVMGFAKDIIAGTPIILNFDLLDIDTANKVIAFLSGAVYAVSGEILEINDKTYLFGNSELYLDGSIEEWLKTNLN